MHVSPTQRLVIERGIHQMAQRRVFRVSAHALERSEERQVPFHCLWDTLESGQFIGVDNKRSNVLKMAKDDIVVAVAIDDQPTILTTYYKNAHLH